MRLSTSTKAVEATELNDSSSYWRPLVLFIPLRLGLTEINPLYFRSLKATFALPQSLGILGGRPNHALYLIGCVGDDLVYLDPHTTQTAVNIAEDVRLKGSSTSETQEPTEDSQENRTNSVEVCDDVSYHCERASRLPITSLDPSLALCFLCTTEEDFEQWAKLMMKKLVGSPQREAEETQPLFEIMKERPANWPNFEEDFEMGAATSTIAKSLHSNQTCSTAPDGSAPSPASSFTALESDEDYEIID